MRKRPVDDDGLGPDDVEFGFGVQSEGNVEGECYCMFHVIGDEWQGSSSHIIM
jgi:hypothetical protein